MELRPYQEKCIEKVLEARKRGVKRVLYVQATGCGKTVTFCNLADKIVREERRPALILAHRDELLTQAARTVRRDCPDFKVTTEGGSQRADKGSHVIVGSVQTLGRKDSKRLDWLETYGPSLIICDEAHHCSSPTYQNVFNRFGAYDGRAMLVGCTATPKRLDRKALLHLEGATFEEQVFTYPLRDAIEDGWLCQVRGYRVVTEVDLSKIKTTSGDYNQGDLAEAVNIQARTINAIEHWQEVAEKRCTVAFCVSVKHAEDVAELWRDKGYKAECVHGGLKQEERDAIIGKGDPARGIPPGRFITGETQIVTNCELLTEGFDHPAIACIVMLRPTKSWGLYMQMVGRGTRLKEDGGDLIIIDVVDNCDKHSLATVPAILDLPPDMDLEGQSVTEVAKKRDEHPEAFVDLRDQMSIKEVDTRLLKVDFFQRVTSPPEVSASAMNWLAVPGGYYLNCGKNRNVKIEEDALGCWHLTAMDEKRIFGPHAVGDDLPGALMRSDAKILSVWPDCYVVAAKGAKWRKGAVSDGQRNVLKRKYSDQEIDQMTKGQASAAIDQMMAGWKKRQPAGRVRAEIPVTQPRGLFDD